MGGGSSKSSNTTRNIDKSINLNEGGIVATEGSNITLTDGGAVESAFEFGELAFVESMEFADNSLAAISQSNTQNVSAVKQLAENLKANETSTSQKIDKFMMYGVIALIIIVLIMVLRGKK